MIAALAVLTVLVVGLWAWKLDEITAALHRWCKGIE